MLNLYVTGVTISNSRFVSNTADNDYSASGGMGGTLQLHVLNKQILTLAPQAEAPYTLITSPPT